MEIKEELIRAKVVGKYNGIILDVKFADDSSHPAFCGAFDIAEMSKIGTIVYVRPATLGNRKVPYEVEFMEEGGSLIYARPNRNNDLFEEAFLQDALPEFAEYDECRRLEAEDYLPHIDFELSNKSGKKAFVFVTNIYHKFGGSAVFPMEVNFFELEMFEEMRRLRAKGYGTYAFMIVPRSDCQDIKFSWKHSPLAAAKIFDEAKNGLNFIGYGCNIDKKSVTLSHLMTIQY